MPPYHPDLSAIELIWATVKNNVAQGSVQNSILNYRCHFYALNKGQHRLSSYMTGPIRHTGLGNFCLNLIMLHMFINLILK